MKHGALSSMRSKFRRHLRRIAFLGLAPSFSMSACSAAVVIRSSPDGAEVLIHVNGQDRPQILGKTPFKRDLRDMETIVRKGSVLITLRKDGYLPRQIVVPDLGHGTLDLEVELNRKEAADYQEINKLIELVLSAERYIMEKRLDEAIKVAAQIKAINKNIAVAHEIEGAAYLAKDELANSRFAWQRVVELTPNNHEAHKILEILETRMGMRRGEKKTAKR